jgi:hypothetical protein
MGHKVVFDKNKGILIPVASKKLGNTLIPALLVFSVVFTRYFLQVSAKKTQRKKTYPL